MGFSSWLKTIFGKQEKYTDEPSIEPITVYRAETPSKIVETRIKPIKIPGIVDVAKQLGIISHILSELRNDMVSKSWFKTKFEDTNPDIINKLEKINSRLTFIQSNFLELNNFTKTLSKNLSDPNKQISFKLSYPSGRLSVSEQILGMLKKNKRIRYKEFVNKLNVTEPTICKYLKILIKSEKIKKFRSGKAVYYEIV